MGRKDQVPFRRRTARRAARGGVLQEGDDMIKVGDQFWHGSIFWPDKGEQLCGPPLRLGERTVGGRPDSPIWTELRTGGWGRWRYCKECYCNVLPYSLIESGPAFGLSVICVCSRCGYGID